MNKTEKVFVQRNQPSISNKSLNKLTPSKVKRNKISKLKSIDSLNLKLNRNELNPLTTTSKIKQQSDEIFKRVSKRVSTRVVNKNNDLKSLLDGIIKKSVIDDKISENLPFKKPIKSTKSILINSSIFSNNEKKKKCLTTNLIQIEDLDIGDEVKFENPGKLNTIEKYLESKEDPKFRLGNIRHEDSTVEILSDLKLYHNNRFGDKDQTSVEKDDNSRILYKFQNILSSDEDDGMLPFEDSISLLQNGSKFKFYWDWILIGLIFYSLFVIPFRLAFKPLSNLSDLIEILVDLIFSTDLFFGFFTPFLDEEDNLIKLKSQTAINYLKTYFTMDFLSSVPITLIMFLNKRSLIENFSMGELNIQDNPVYNILKWMKILRIFKLSYYQKRKGALSRITLTKNVKINRILKIVFNLLIFFHILTCFWIFVGNLRINASFNWIISNNLKNSPLIDIYIASYYFQLVTIYTIGYGDILCVNMAERIFNIFLLVFGVMAFSFTISSLSSYFGETDKNKQVFKEKLVELKSLMETYKFSRKFYVKIKQSLRSHYLKSQNERIQFLENLPKKQKQDLMITIYQKEIQEMKFFKNSSHDFVLYVLPLLRSLIVLKNDVLISKGEFVKEMYLVSKGSLSLYSMLFANEFEVCRIVESNHFGDITFMNNTPFQFTLRGKAKISKVFVLQKEDFFKIKDWFRETTIKIFENSYNFFENVVKKKELIESLLSYEANIKIVEKKLKNLRRYFFNKGFHDFYYHEKNFEDLNDFITKNDSEFVQKFLQEIENTSMKFEFDNKVEEKFKKNEIVENKTEVNNFESLKNLEISLGNDVKMNEKIEKKESILQDIGIKKQDSIVDFRTKNRFKSLDNIRHRNDKLDSEFDTSNFKRKGSKKKTVGLNFFKSIEEMEKNVGIDPNIGRKKSKIFSNKKEIVKKFIKKINQPNQDLLKQESTLIEKTINLFNFDKQITKRSDKCNIGSKMSTSKKLANKSKSELKLLRNENNYGINEKKQFVGLKIQKVDQFKLNDRKKLNLTFTNFEFEISSKLPVEKQYNEFVQKNNINQDKNTITGIQINILKDELDKLNYENFRINEKRLDSIFDTLLKSSINSFKINE